MTTNPTLEEFQSCTRQEFAFLIDEHGFTEVPTMKDENDFLVRFEKYPVQVNIEGINWGFGVQVMLANLAAGNNQVAKVPLWAIVEFSEPGALKHVSDQLQELAILSEAIKIYGANILNGDFSIFPDAYKLMMKIANQEKPERKLP